MTFAVLLGAELMIVPRFAPDADDYQFPSGRQLAEDFSLYLHAPTRTDPSLAPPGCENFYVLSPVPHMESGTDWAAEEPRYQEKLFAYLEA